LSALRGIAPQGGHHPSGCNDGGRELVIGDSGPRWRLLGFVVQNQRNDTVGPYQTTLARQAEEATTKGGRDLARVGRARWHYCAIPAQGDRATQHSYATFPVRARASWQLGFAS